MLYKQCSVGLNFILLKQYWKQECKGSHGIYAAWKMDLLRIQDAFLRQYISITVIWKLWTVYGDAFKHKAYNMFLHGVNFILYGNV